MLSLRCAPLLKESVLHALGAGDDALAAFEPVLAAAWEQWEYQVRFWCLICLLGMALRLRMEDGDEGWMDRCK
jgi:hypothetical protein